jgi:phosphomannomutase
MSELVLSVSGARGKVGQGLNAEVATRLAAALGSLLGRGLYVLGRDSRPSGDHLAAAVRAGLQAVGADVVEVGIVPTPTVQVAVELLEARGGIVVSASHNPPEWNALKFVGPGGRFLDPAQARRLFALYETGRFAWAAHGGIGRLREGPDVLAMHRRRILSLLEPEEATKIREARLRILLDAVHGAGGVLLVPLLEEMGVRVVAEGCEPDGQLPPDPEPRPEALRELAARSRAVEAHLALRTDPDGDRLAVALPEGPDPTEEWTLPLAAWHALEQRRGPLVTNLSTSGRLEWVAERFGVEVHRTPVGEAHVVQGIREHRAVLGGEGNGGVIDPRCHLGRDAGCGIVHLLALHTGRPGGLAAAMAAFPPLEMVKMKRPRPDDYEGLAQRLLEAFQGIPVDTRDGLRWQFPEGWVHLRPSGTEPVVRLVAEGPTREAAEALLRKVREAGGL